MSRKRMLFIYNPHSGKELVRTNLPGILDIFSATDYEVITHATQGRLDARNLAAEYVRDGLCDIIVCAGGDGTLDEVAGAVMSEHADVPIGYIPAGSTNDFGYSLGIPQDIIGAARSIVEGRSFRCDIASFNDRYFTYTAAFGMFAEVSYDTPQNIKNAIGHAAYILNGMSKLTQMKKYHAIVDYDGGRIEDDFILGMVVSSNSVGGFKGITGNDVELDDGKHELILIRAPKHIGGLTTAVNEVLAHKFTDGRYLCYARVTHADFTFDQEVPWSLDGEYGGSGTEFKIEVIRQGINYIVPKEDDRG